MIFASDFRKGTKFLHRDEPHVVVDFQHVKPGKGGAFVRTKMKLDTYVREIFESKEDGKIEYTVTTPVFEYGTNNFNGVIVGRVNIEVLNKVMTARIGLGETGETYLVNNLRII